LHNPKQGKTLGWRAYIQKLSRRGRGFEQLGAERGWCGHEYELQQSPALHCMGQSTPDAHGSDGGGPVHRGVREQERVCDLLSADSECVAKRSAAPDVAGVRARAMSQEEVDHFSMAARRSFNQRILALHAASIEVRPGCEQTERDIGVPLAARVLERRVPTGRRHVWVRTAREQLADDWFVAGLSSRVESRVASVIRSVDAVHLGQESADILKGAARRVFDEVLREVLRHCQLKL
jgi:hypothetical protein